MEKAGNAFGFKELTLHWMVWRNLAVFPRGCRRAGFQQEFFSFPPEFVEKAHRLELMLVLISFTVSAKAGSFFIFFSTCWMEYSTVE